jgi:hypothetical protein
MTRDAGPTEATMRESSRASLRTMVQLRATDGTHRDIDRDFDDETFGVPAGSPEYELSNGTASAVARGTVRVEAPCGTTTSGAVTTGTSDVATTGTTVALPPPPITGSVDGAVSTGTHSPTVITLSLGVLVLGRD